MKKKFIKPQIGMLQTVGETILTGSGSTNSVVGGGSTLEQNAKAASGELSLDF